MSVVTTRRRVIRAVSKQFQLFACISPRLDVDSTTPDRAGQGLVAASEVLSRLLTRNCVLRLPAISTRSIHLLTRAQHSPETTTGTANLGAQEENITTSVTLQFTMFFNNANCDEGPLLRILLGISSLILSFTMTGFSLTLALPPVCPSVPMTQHTLAIGTDRNRSKRP